MERVLPPSTFPGGHEADPRAFGGRQGKAVRAQEMVRQGKAVRQSSSTGEVDHLDLDLAAGHHVRRGRRVQPRTGALYREVQVDHVVPGGRGRVDRQAEGARVVQDGVEHVYDGGEPGTSGRTHGGLEVELGQRGHEAVGKRDRRALSGGKGREGYLLVTSIYWSRSEVGWGALATPAA